MERRLTLGSLFRGIGGFDRGFEDAGRRIVKALRREETPD